MISAHKVTTDHGFTFIPWLLDKLSTQEIFANHGNINAMAVSNQVVNINVAAKTCMKPNTSADNHKLNCFLARQRRKNPAEEALQDKTELIDF
ncbi:hypothetical protein [Vibrio sp. 1F279]|uniref:hypothetical protein n=1 Tax=unclassified Vibrio TaxID=2614977 RepID=UPI00352F3FE0